MKINFILGEFAQMPTNSNIVGRARDAGYDVYFAEREHITLRPGERRVFYTNLSWEPIFDNLIEKLLFKLLHMDVYIDIRDRSGISLKQGLLKMGGIVDPNFRGNIGVILLNVSQEVVTIRPQDRIAQIIFSICVHPTSLIETKELSITTRGSNGFGSTGI